MKIHLISSDQQLYRLCRDTLAQIPGRQWEFAATAPNGRPPIADLYIWDFDPAIKIPDILDFSEERKNIFLVQRQELELLREQLPLAALAVLLKPVNQATLRAFVEHAVARYEATAGKIGTGLESLRSDRDEMLQCLLHANLKLQEYDQDRTSFLARAVHDFRTPITAASGYCGLLLGRQLGPLSAEQAEVLTRMQHSIKRLSRMATAMFQLSVGHHTRKSLELQRADVEACIEHAVHEATPLALEKHIAIRVGVKPPPRPLYFEPAQIEQVLVNLLENACKFTPKHGAIEVRGVPIFWERRTSRIHGGQEPEDRRRLALREPNAFRVEVQDFGSGIPAEHLEKIFEEYTSYGGGQDRSGAGLGLAICKMIVTSHQGRVWAESNGEGATFSFVLPLSPGVGSPSAASFLQPATL